MIVIAAAVAYAVAVALGLGAALTTKRFGRWHHVVFATACVGAAAAVIFEPHLSMIIPLSMLVILPFTRGGSRPHALVGITGLVGWVLVLLTKFV